ncbi:MAG: hypothetical protein RLZZ397_1080 [Pseudomonadota bacterium]|jgi:HTH-type transcriptional regulator/antitoxin HigA
MNIKPIKSQRDYQQALKQITALMALDPKVGSEQGDLLDVLVTLVQAYETKHEPIEAPDPIEAIKFRMEQGELTIKDLEPMIGKSNRVYEVLNRKRPLSLAMVRKIHSGLGIAAEVLIAEPKTSYEV